MRRRRAAVDQLLVRMAAIFGDRMRTDSEALSKVSGDESGLPPGEPAAVFFPMARDDVVQLARCASERGVAMVPRGGGTGKAGACIPSRGQVVVDFSRMNRQLALELGDMYVVVQPGLVVQDLHTAMAERGHLYPPDPGSSDSCTVGGNIATNAGGMRALKYGVTQRYVWGVEVVLATGDVMRFGRRSLKGVVGYDLTSLMVGSEGTLGFITEATLHVIPAPPAVETAWLTFPDLATADRAAQAMFAAGMRPRLLEMMDETALACGRATSVFRYPEAGGAALLIETDGTDEQARTDLEAACGIAVATGATDSALAKNEKERDSMRRTRKLVSTALKDAYPDKISDDIAVPRSRMTELLARAAEAGERAGILVCAYGHLGDGNLHINLLCRNRAEREAAEGLRRRILELTIGMGGTLSGEHGIGLAKRDLLTIEQSAQVIQLQRRLKKTFDPRGFMNPGKVFPPT